MTDTALLTPGLPHLAEYADALKRGWSPDNLQRGRGCASAALRLMLPLAAARGLPYVLPTSDDDNLASQAVIRANGGREVERFRTAPAYGGHAAVRFRIDL